MSIGTYISEQRSMNLIKDGKHFCRWCGKLIKNEQLFISKSSPMPFRRENKISYFHKDCFLRK